MHSPRAEWSLFVLHFAALDWWRHRGDGDGDTASEVIRELVVRHPHGRAIFTVGLAAAAVGFHRHIVAPLDNH